MSPPAQLILIIVSPRLRERKFARPEPYRLCLCQTGYRRSRVWYSARPTGPAAALCLSVWGRD